MVCRCLYGSDKFFRQRVLTQPQEEILIYVQQIEKEALDIKRDLLKICWYMRGMSYQEALHLSYDERKIIGDIIKENLETTKKSGLPFF